MRTPPARRCLLATLLALAPGCGLLGSGDGGVRLPLQLVTRSCRGTQPLEGATHLRLRVTGEGMEAQERLVPVDALPGALEDVPPGPARVLEVRAYRERPGAGGRVLALGRTRPFDVAEEAPAPARVVLRRANAFTPVSDPQRPEACATLAAARAGHTATLLADGRVLVAGGFALEGKTRVALASTELYASDSGALSAGPELAGAGGAAPRAFHTASLLPSGRVLLAGGEGPAPLAEALLLDPAGGALTSLALARPRSRHAAAVDRAGRVLLAGGVGEREEVLTEAEGLLPEEGRRVPVAVPLGRLGAAALALPDGAGLAVAGGGDARALSADAAFLRFDGSGFVSAGPAVPLLQPRRGAALAPFGAGQLLLLGGYDAVPGEPGTARALATSELLPPRPGGAAAPGPNLGPRAELCAVGLPDGRVLTVGGLSAQPGLPARSSAAAELIVSPTEGALPVVLGLPRLEAGRWGHTCTLLGDGTVLIAGGLRDERTAGGEVAFEVRADLLIFTPPPLD